MYSTYLLGLFLLVGVDAKESVLEVEGGNQYITFNATYGQVEGAQNLTFFEFDAENIRNLQTAINEVISRFLHVSEIEITLRSVDIAKLTASKRIKSIGDAISNKLKNVVNSFGFTKSNRLLPVGSKKLTDSDNLKVSVYHELLRFPLVLSSIGKDIFGLITNHMRKSNYAKMGYKALKFGFDDYNDFSEELKFTGFFGKLRTYCSNFYNCLGQKPSAKFDLKAAIGKLMNYPPEVTGKIVRNRLKKQVPYNKDAMKNEYNSFHAFVCHGVADVSKPEYFHCLEAVKHAHSCSHKKPGKFSKHPKKPCKDLIGEMKDFADGKLKSYAPKSNEFPHIIDFLMGDLKTFPNLERMAYALGSVMKKSRMASAAINEIAGLIDIYNYGVKTKANLIKAAQKNSFNKTEYIKITNTLNSFDQHFTNMILKTVGHVHEVMSTVENVLVDAALKGPGYDLSENAKAMKCWSDFMDSVFDKWSNTPASFPAKPDIHEFISSSKNLRKDSENSQSNNLIKVPNEVGLVKDVYDEPLNNFIKSLKRVSDLTMTSHKSTALTTLANTFLLATVFYECIAVLAASIYRGNNNPVLVHQIPSYDGLDNWISRETRSLSWVNEKDLLSQESENKEGSLLEPSVLPEVTNDVNVTTDFAENETPSSSSYFD